MKIDFSKWIIIFNPDGFSFKIDNLTEGVSLLSNSLLSYDSKELDGFDDPMEYLKLIAKRQIMNYYVSQQINYFQGQSIPVQDNLDYIEKEAKKRKLID